MKKSCIPLIFFLGISLTVIAQKESYKELRGDKFYAYYSYDKAIHCYSHTKHLSVEGQRRLTEPKLNLKSMDLERTSPLQLLTINIRRSVFTTGR